MKILAKKMIGIIALVAIIGFNSTSCSTDDVTEEKPEWPKELVFGRGSFDEGIWQLENNTNAPDATTADELHFANNPYTDYNYLFAYTDSFYGRYNKYYVLVSNVQDGSFKIRESVSSSQIVATGETITATYTLINNVLTITSVSPEHLGNYTLKTGNTFSKDSRTPGY
ncbi:MAG: hypothetical protein LBI03_10980 [Clostridiales bacterium]|jgi:hypothetical protein|nr:hypothetical protein [Clostridiales bacterium]